MRLPALHRLAVRFCDTDWNYLVEHCDFLRFCSGLTSFEFAHSEAVRLLSEAKAEGWLEN